MRGKFGLFVVGLAAAVLIASESDSFAGRKHRGCSSCQAGCATCPAPAPEEKAPAAAAAPDAKASQSVAKADESPASTPAVTAPESTKVTYSTSRRAARRGARR